METHLRPLTLGEILDRTVSSIGLTFCCSLASPRCTRASFSFSA